jgi:hypothetical protein
MKYTIYDPATGHIQRVIFGDNPDWMQQNLAGQSYVPGEFDGTKYYIHNDQALLKPVNPSNGQQVHKFDYSSKSWQLDLTASEAAVRKLRNIELATVDKINPVWFSTLSSQQQQELAVYRQALLDVPQQTGFPGTVDWPAKPTWL